VNGEWEGDGGEPFSPGQLFTSPSRGERKRGDAAGRIRQPGGARKGRARPSKGPAFSPSFECVVLNNEGHKREKGPWTPERKPKIEKEGKSSKKGFCESWTRPSISGGK